jgi:hypothetical protein
MRRGLGKALPFLGSALPPGGETRPREPGTTRAIPGASVRHVTNARRDKEPFMLTTILVLLVVLWLLGMVSSYTLGGFIHVLLLIAIAMVLIRIIQGRRPV